MGPNTFGTNIDRHIAPPNEAPDDVTHAPRTLPSSKSPGYNASKETSQGGVQNNSDQGHNKHADGARRVDKRQKILPTILNRCHHYQRGALEAI